MELIYNKLSLLCFSVLFSTTIALAATDNIITTPVNNLELHSVKEKQLSPPIDLPFKLAVGQKKHLAINKIQKHSKSGTSKSFSVSTASTSSAPLNYWTNIIIAGSRTFSGIKTLGGVYDPSITGDGNIVTIRDGVNGELVNINYSNPSSPTATNITPNGMSGASYPMAVSAYVDTAGQYRSGMWGPLIKPGIVKVNPSGNAWSNTSHLYDTFPAAGHTHDIDRYGDKLAIMRRANDGDGWKHNIMSVDTSTVYNSGSFSRKLLSNEYGQEFVNASSNSQHPKISGSGQFIAYQSNSHNIVQNDTNYKRDIFVVNTTTQKNAFTRNERINLASDGTQANGSSSSPDISDDGRLIVYSTTATNLVTQGVGGIILHDRLLNTNTLISVNASGIAATNYDNPSMSYDGRFIAFESSDNNLTSDDVTGSNAYVYDSTTGEVRLASYSFTDGSYNLTVSRTTISANGDHLVFLSGEYVYRVESPFEVQGGLTASVLTDEDKDIYAQLTPASPAFKFPIKLVNSSNVNKVVSIQHYVLFHDGSSWVIYGGIHSNLCGQADQKENSDIVSCVNNIPTYSITPNESSPNYVNYYDMPIYNALPTNVNSWMSYFIVIDETTGLRKDLQMQFYK